MRYERKHGLSAGHIDWHDGLNDMGVCIITDDSSRKILAGGEFVAQNTENGKLVFSQVVDKYWSLRPMRELIMDHGILVLIVRMIRGTGMVNSRDLSKGVERSPFAFALAIPSRMGSSRSPSIVMNYTEATSAPSRSGSTGITA